MKKAISIITALGITASMAVSAFAYETASAGGSSLNIVKVPMNGSVVGEVITAYGTVNTDISAWELVDAGKTGGKTVVASVNGLFFNSYYSGSNITFPDNCPLILTNLVQNGEMIVGGGEHNSLILTQDGQAIIDRVNVTDQAYINGKGPAQIWTVNGKNENAEAIIKISDEMTLPYTVGSGATAYLIENGIVSASYSAGQVITLQNGQSLIVYNSGSKSSHAAWGLVPSVGNRVSFEPSITYSGGSLSGTDFDIVGGGRMLIHNGQNVNTNSSYNAGLDADPKQNATSVLQRSFVATMSDGSVILGTGVASFAQIADYLQSIGATDAMSLDGGASSMLYENGNYVTSAGRELASVLVFTQSGSGATTPTTPTTQSINAVSTSSDVYVDGELVKFPTYNIDGNNYVKLRDLAFVIDGTEKQFNVDWNGEKNLITLIPNRAYSKVGGEMASLPEGAPQSIVLSDSKLEISSETVSPTAYNINGNNFIKLRDLAEIIDISLDWDEKISSVIIETDGVYSE